MQRYLKTRQKFLTEDEGKSTRNDARTCDDPFFFEYDIDIADIGLEARHYLKQVVDGMLYLQHHRILHRDLTLSNLLLTKEMNIVSSQKQ